MKNHHVILVLYVDDLFLTGEEHLIAQTKRELSAEFELKDLGLIHYLLRCGRNVVRFFSHKVSMQLMCFADFGILDCKFMTTPMISKLKKLHPDYWVLDVSGQH